MANTTKRGRDAGTGQFIPVRVAVRRPATTVIETIPVRRPAMASVKPKGK